MSLLEKVLGMCGLNDQISQEIKGVLEWVDQQGGVHAIVEHLQSGEFSEVVNSWLGDEKNVALSKDIVERMFNSASIQQLANGMGINTNDALELLVKYFPQLVDKASPAGTVDKQADLASIVSQLVH